MDRTINSVRGIINIYEEQVISGRLQVKRKHSILVTGSGGAVTTALPSICEQSRQLRLYRVTLT